MEAPLKVNALLSLYNSTLGDPSAHPVCLRAAAARLFFCIWQCAHMCVPISVACAPRGRRPRRTDRSFVVVVTRARSDCFLILDYAVEVAGRRCRLRPVKTLCTSPGRAINIGVPSAGEPRAIGRGASGEKLFWHAERVFSWRAHAMLLRAVNVRGEPVPTLNF